jgi:hypothetical protein
MNHRGEARDGPPLVRVVHHTRGRLRLRVPAPDGESLSDALASIPGIQATAWSPLTRGLLISYDPASTNADAILEAVGNHPDFQLGDIDWDGRRPPETQPTLAEGVSRTVGELDERVHRLSRGTLGLGVLIPAALTLWAVSEIARGRVGPLSWSSALWYAHGLFRDYFPRA